VNNFLCLFNYEAKWIKLTLKTQSMCLLLLLLRVILFLWCIMCLIFHNTQCHWGFVLIPTHSLFIPTFPSIYHKKRVLSFNNLQIYLYDGKIPTAMSDCQLSLNCLKMKTRLNIEKFFTKKELKNDNFCRTLIPSTFHTIQRS